MKKLIHFAVLIVLTLATALAFAADPVAAAAPAAAAPTFMAWFAANENAVLKLALSVSEFLALFKAFQGNGIIDTLIKAFRFMLNKNGVATEPTA